MRAVLLAALLACAQSVAAQPTFTRRPTPGVASEAAAVLVGLKAGGLPGALPGLPGLKLPNLTAILDDLATMPLARGESAAAGVARALRDPGVAYAEANFRFRLAKTPNDSLYPRLWAMPKIGAPATWDATTGAATANTKVCIIDTGIDGSHPDLRGRVLAQNTYLNGNGRVTNTRIYDDVGHGTHVAGTIAAIGNNGAGVAGLNYGGIQLLSCKFMDDTGGWLADAVACVTWCTAQGAVMSTNSWGGGSYSRALENAIKQAAAKSSFFVVAAGNDGLNLDAIPDYPASYKTINMVSVAASAPSDALAPWSNFGRATVDLAAPGVDILSTVPGGGYDTWSGTSMATPHATGTLALMRAACAASRRVATCPLSMAELRAALLRAVDPVASPTVTGGRLNASKAVAAVALAAPGAPSSPLPPAVTCAAFNARCGASSLTRAACCPGRACRYANRVYTCR